MMKIFLFVTLFLIFARNADCVISLDSNGTGSATPPNSTAAVALNVVGPARVLVCAGLASSGIVNGITWNGSAMTSVGTSAHIGSGQISLFYLANPATGTHNAAVTISIGSGPGIACDILSGVDQVVIFDTTTCTSGNSKTASNTILPISNNDWIIDFLGAPTGQSWLSASSQANIVGGAGPTTFQDTGTLGPISPPSSQTLSWTTTPAASNWAVCDYALKLSGASPIFPSERSLLGIGQ